MCWNGVPVVHLSGGAQKKGTGMGLGPAERSGLDISDWELLEEQITKPRGSMEHEKRASDTVLRSTSCRRMGPLAGA